MSVFISPNHVNRASVNSPINGYNKGKKGYYRDSHKLWRQQLLDAGEIFKIFFDEDIVKVRRKIGKKLASHVVKTQRGKMKMSGSSRRRLMAIRHIVGKDGTLVFLDHAPLASAQEYGETVYAKGGYLAVGKAGQGYGKPGTKSSDLFTIRKKNGTLLLVKKNPDDSIESVATLLKSVRIKKSLGFYEKVEAMLPRYIEEIQQELWKGFKYNGIGFDDIR